MAYQCVFFFPQWSFFLTHVKIEAMGSVLYISICVSRATSLEQFKAIHKLSTWTLSRLPHQKTIPHSHCHKGGSRIAIDLSKKLTQTEFTPPLGFSTKAGTYWTREWQLGTVLTSLGPFPVTNHNGNLFRCCQPLPPRHCCLRSIFISHRLTPDHSVAPLTSSLQLTSSPLI